VHIISVIIPVKNEADNIEQCLEAVFSQSPKPHEVIVVDGHSTDKTVESAKKFPVDVVYDDYGTVRHIEQIMRVCGHDVGFMDAGCIHAKKNWLANLVNDFDNDVGAKGGMIR